MGLTWTPVGFDSAQRPYANNFGPRSERYMPAKGAGPMAVNSTKRMPSNGPGTSHSLFMDVGN